MAKMTENELKKGIWDELSKLLSSWFYSPDLDALRVVLSVYVSHLLIQEEREPVWILIIGPPSTGKTSFLCHVISGLPFIKKVADLSGASFISGLAVKKGGSSLLFDLAAIGDSKNKSDKSIKTHGVLIFPDFSSLVSQKQETRAEIMAKLRQIHDGEYNPSKGTVTKGWEGKVSVIAAVTEAIEQMWAVQRELGDRFVQIRWDRGDGEKQAAAVMEQVDGKVLKKVQGLVEKLVDITTLPGNMAIPMEFRGDIIAVAEMAAVLRASVTRGRNGQIIDVLQAEGTGRLTKAAKQIVVGHARLFRKIMPDYEDVKLAKRVIFDSIPRKRIKIIDAIGDKGATPAEVVKETGLYYSSVDYACEELLAMNVIKETREILANKTVSKYELMGWFADIRTRAMIGGKKGKTVIDFPIAKEG